MSIRMHLCRYAWCCVESMQKGSCALAAQELYAAHIELLSILLVSQKDMDPI